MNLTAHERQRPLDENERQRHLDENERQRSLADNNLAGKTAGGESLGGLSFKDSQRSCPAVADILARVGDKWSMLVVMTLLEGTMRFNALKREIGTISQQMLSRTLRALERDGLVVRTVHATVPVQVDYTLSPLGLSLSGPVRQLGEWALDNRVVIEASRAGYDRQEHG